MSNFIYRWSYGMVINNETLTMKKLYDDNDSSQVFVEEPVVQVEQETKEPEVLDEAKQAELNKLYESIKHTAQNTTATIKTTRFTRGKGDVSFKLDGSTLEPKRSTMVGAGTFEERYLKQLNSCIYTDKDQLDPDGLIPLLILLEMSDKGNKTIHVKTGKYKLMAGKMTACLNKFFEDNQQVLESMFKMFSDIQSMPPQEKEQK